MGKLTVCHCGRPGNVIYENFDEVVLKKCRFAGFKFQRGLYSLAREYNLVIGMFDLSWPLIWLFPFFSKKKFFLFGTGVSTGIGLDKDRSKDFLRYFAARKADGIIFYSDYPLDKYMERGFNPGKLISANNTVYNPKRINTSERRFDKFLFFGSLTKRKDVKVLIDSFIKIQPQLKEGTFLEIAGDGDEREELERYVEELNATDSVLFLGEVYSHPDKEKVFKNAICTISPNQAGLSVLESFSYGVPFVTSENSITGGEIFNIENSKNGFLYSNEEDLCDIMLRLYSNTELAKEMSENAFNHYWNNRTIDKMGNSFLEIIERNIVREGE